MWPTICHCCGGKMNVASPTNPNICLSCEQMLLDDSPMVAAQACLEKMPFPESSSEEVIRPDQLRPTSKEIATPGKLA